MHYAYRLVFSLKPTVFSVEMRKAWFPFEANHKERETWPTRNHSLKRELGFVKEVAEFLLAFLCILRV